MASKITIINLVQVPLRLVWSSWANPQHITNGNFAPSHRRCPSATSGLKIGGKFNY